MLAGWWETKKKHEKGKQMQPPHLKSGKLQYINLFGIRCPLKQLTRVGISILYRDMVCCTDVLVTVFLIYVLVMQELHRLQGSADSVCVPQLSSTFQAFQSESGTLEGSISTSAPRPVLNCARR